MKVLLADDSDLILDRLRNLLETHKQVKIIAMLKNGSEALDAIINLKPDLAIIDIKMPGLTGLEVIKEIRKSDNTCKFIVLSFFSSEYYRQMAILAGADHFFSKADDFGKIFQVIEQMSQNAENLAKFKLKI